MGFRGWSPFCRLLSRKTSLGGLLIRTHAVELETVADGLSNTLLIGEQSGYLRDSSGTKSDRRGDNYHGFPMGSAPHSTIDKRDWNITTVRYGINERNLSLVGIGGPGDWPCNSPIQSAHSGGAAVLFGDGSVHFLNEQIELSTLKNLANRDDKQPIGEY